MKWFSTKKFLPPFHERVILYIPNVENVFEFNVGYLETEGNFYFNDIDENIDSLSCDLVTHWAKLPEKPI